MLSVSRDERELGKKILTFGKHRVGFWPLLEEATCCGSERGGCVMGGSSMVSFLNIGVLSLYRAFALKISFCQF